MLSIMYGLEQRPFFAGTLHMDVFIVSGSGRIKSPHKPRVFVLIALMTVVSKRHYHLFDMDGFSGGVWGGGGGGGGGGSNPPRVG